MTADLAARLRAEAERRRRFDDHKLDRLLSEAADALDARPVADREALVAAMNEAQQSAGQVLSLEALADALLSSGVIRPAEPPVVDREALARRLHHLATCPENWDNHSADDRDDHYRDVDSILASGVVQDAAVVRAEQRERIAVAFEQMPTSDPGTQWANAEAAKFVRSIREQGGAARRSSSTGGDRG